MITVIKTCEVKKMKHSPHRYKQLRKKAVRKFSQVDLSMEGKKTNLMVRYLTNGANALSNNLAPFDHNRAHEMIHFFKKHQEKMHTIETHHFKDTSHKEIAAEGPYSQLKHHNNQSGKSISKDLEKSSQIARKVLKFQNDTHHKKAA